MSKFNVSQKVRVVDAASDHHGQVGTVAVIAPKKDSVSYWLMFSPIPSGGPPEAGEEQLQAAS